MDTESRYLRDIRDAIKGIAKRSGMDVSGNTKSKYLKEIADAIRENGGGGHDGNDKVKQTPVVTTEQSFDSYNVLLSGSNTNFSSSEITEGARKSPGFEYHADKTQLLVRNKECNTYGYTNKPNIGIFYGKEVEHVYSYKGAMLLTDDVSLSGNDNTWDGTNTSLKAALADAKSNDVFVVDVSYGNTGDFKTLAYTVNYTYNFTQSTGSEGSLSPVYLNKTYSEISEALSNGKLVLFYNENSHITYINTRGVIEQGVREYIESKTPLFDLYFNNTDICGITSTITVEKPSE